ncbi:EAL domain-containing protein [Escherichia coli]|uniref:EAL domain-containing protein n=1 Tax=Escherichia coli TaxID=562 RepID=UPI001F105AD8|nr:EAL domain-containing protein [Escherichia coli]UMS16536.1 EAL domain-containing protein [Escherichia coli]
MQTGIYKDFSPWFQPVVSPFTKEIKGLEVLARSNKNLQTETVISGMELSGEIIHLTRKMLTDTAFFLSKFSDCVPDDFRIGVNISVADILNPDFENDCASFLRKFSPGKIRLMLELTERHPYPLSVNMFRKLERLKQTGVELAIDDFGTGYATHSYVMHFPVDQIKIPGLFVQQLHVNEKSEKIIDNIVSLAREVGAGVIAEGIETETQGVIMASKNVDLLQGYLYSPPVSPEVFVQKYFTEKEFS